MSEAKIGAEEIQIDAVRPDELEELADLASRTFSDAFGDVMDPEDLARSLEENRSVAYFERTLETSKVKVARYQGKIVGYVQYGSVLIPEVNAAPEDREIGRVYVETGLQGRGLGRQLMDTALADPDTIKAPNVYLQVWEENANAITMYKSFDFEECGVTHFELAGKPAQDLIMVRRQHPSTAA